jgi:hypothetical protein
MASPTAARIERTPSHNDLEIADLVHHALAAVRDVGRFGDRKVFISSLWIQMRDMEARTGRTLTDGATIDHFKAWLLRARLLTRDGAEDGAPLIVVCRADLVAAMDPARVAASETIADGASFHFVLDPAVARDDYAPPDPDASAAAHRTSGSGRKGGRVPMTALEETRTRRSQREC